MAVSDRAPAKLGWRFGTSAAATFAVLTALTVPWAGLSVSAVLVTILAITLPSAWSSPGWWLVLTLWSIWGLYTRWLIRRANDVDRGIELRRRMAALGGGPVVAREEGHLDAADRALLSTTRYLRAELRTGESSDIRTALVAWLQALRAVSPNRAIELEKLGLAHEQVEGALASRAEGPGPLNPLLEQLSGKLENRLVRGSATGYR